MRYQWKTSYVWKTMTANDIEAYEERAAILEFDAGMSRTEAEREAMRQIGITPEDLIEFEAGQLIEFKDGQFVVWNINPKAGQ